MSNNWLRSRQLNPCDELYWKSRGYAERPQNWKQLAYSTSEKVELKKELPNPIPQVVQGKIELSNPTPQIIPERGASKSELTDWAPQVVQGSGAIKNYVPNAMPENGEVNKELAYPVPKRSEKNKESSYRSRNRRTTRSHPYYDPNTHDEGTTQYNTFFITGKAHIQFGGTVTYINYSKKVSSYKRSNYCYCSYN